MTKTHVDLFDMKNQRYYTNKILNNANLLLDSEILHLKYEFL